MKGRIVTGIAVLFAVLFVVGIGNRKRSACVSCGVSSSCPDGLCTLPIPAGRPLGEDGAETSVPSASEHPLPSLVVLGARDCVSCQKMIPIVKRLAADFSGRFDVEGIDVSENPDVADGFGIRTTPTQIFFDGDGNELYRHEGFFSREEILAKWKELGVGTN